MMNETDYHRALTSTPKRMIALLVIMGLTVLLGLYVTFVKTPDAQAPGAAGAIIVPLDGFTQTLDDLPPDPASDMTSEPRVLAGEVGRIWEGDTLLVGETAIQLSALDCATTRTVFGQLAAQKAHDLVDGQTLSCQLQGRRVGNLEIADCTMPDGQDLGQAMLTAGVCGNSKW